MGLERWESIGATAFLALRCIVHGLDCLGSRGA